MLRINNDRIGGYQKASELVQDRHLRELQHLFNQYCGQSSTFIDQFSPLLDPSDTADLDETKFSGKVFRLWMDLKTSLSTSTTLAVLELCEWGEQEFQDVYEHIRQQAAAVYLSDLTAILQHHQDLQETASQHIKRLRQQQK